MLLLWILWLTRTYPTVWHTHDSKPLPATHCVPYREAGAPFTSYQCVDEAACKDTLNNLRGRKGVQVLGGCTLAVDRQCFTLSNILGGEVCRPDRASCERERGLSMKLDLDVTPCTPAGTPYVVHPEPLFSRAVPATARARGAMACHVVDGAFRCMPMAACTRATCVETNVWCFRVVLRGGVIREACHPMHAICDAWRTEAAQRGVAEQCRVISAP